MRSHLQSSKTRTSMCDPKRSQSSQSKYSSLFLLQTLLHLRAPLATQTIRASNQEEHLVQVSCPAEACTTMSIAYTDQHRSSFTDLSHVCVFITCLCFYHMSVINTCLCYHIPKHRPFVNSTKQ